MARTDLWKYCSAEQCREMMLSFRLVGAGDWPPEKIMGCLYALSNYAEKHYQRVNIPKRSGGFRTLLVPDPLLKNVQRNLLHHVLDGFTAVSYTHLDVYKRQKPDHMTAGKAETGMGMEPEQERPGTRTLLPPGPLSCIFFLCSWRPGSSWKQSLRTTPRRLSLIHI